MKAISRLIACDVNTFREYTNGCDGYLLTADEYDKGEYEVLRSYLSYYIYHGMVMHINRDIADKLVRIVTEHWRKEREAELRA